jgi:hypothetical protein
VRDRVAIIDVESKWRSPKVGPDRDYGLDVANKSALNNEMNENYFLSELDFRMIFVHFCIVTRLADFYNFRTVEQPRHIVAIPL